MLKLGAWNLKRALSTEKQIALEMDLLMERGRGRCQQLWPPYALFQKKVSAQCLQKSLEHTQDRKKEGPLAIPSCSSDPHSSIWNRARRGTHWLRLPQRWQEVCGAGPKHTRADGAAPRWPSSCPGPRLPVEASNPPSPPQSLPIPAKWQKLLKL